MYSCQGLVQIHLMICAVSSLKNIFSCVNRFRFSLVRARLCCCWGCPLNNLTKFNLNSNPANWYVQIILLYLFHMYFHEGRRYNNDLINFWLNYITNGRKSNDFGALQVNNSGV